MCLNSNMFLCTKVFLIFWLVHVMKSLQQWLAFSVSPVEKQMGAFRFILSLWSKYKIVSTLVYLAHQPSQLFLFLVQQFFKRSSPKCFQKDAEFLCSSEGKNWNENLHTKCRQEIKWKVVPIQYQISVNPINIVLLQMSSSPFLLFLLIHELSSRSPSPYISLSPGWWQHMWTPRSECPDGTYQSTQLYMSKMM